MQHFVKGLVVTAAIINASLAAQAQKSGAAAMPVAEKKYVSEIRALAARPAVKKAMQAIIDMQPQTLSDHILLTEIPAPPFKETQRAEKYASMMKAAGADSVWIDKVGNVIAKRKGRTGKKTVVLEGHLDTVFPEGTDVTVKHKGDTLYAPGIIDDTRALSLVHTILKIMEQTGIETEADILFCGVVGEEGQGDLRGVKHLFSDGGPGKIDAYIAIDGWNMEGITHRGLGSHRYRVTFKGPGGHSSGAFGLANPHNALGRTIHYWSVAADTFTRQEGVRVTYNVGVIGGGTSVNSIPFESWMEVDMRSESPERLAGVDKLLQDAIQRALREENEMKRSGAPLTVDVKLIGDRPSGGSDSTLPLIQYAKSAIAFVGGAPKLGVSSTNANIPISKGVPAITMGSGGKGGNAHALDEWWIDDQSYLATQRTLLVLLAEAGIAK